MANSAWESTQCGYTAHTHLYTLTHCPSICERDNSNENLRLSQLVEYDSQLKLEENTL
jgi:hypothetical protein